MARGRQATLEADVAQERKPEEGEKARTGRGDAAAATWSGQTPVDLDFVRGLIEAVDRSGIDSLEITRAGTRVKISKTPPAAVGSAPLYAPPPGMHLPAPQPAPAGSPLATGGGGSAPAEEKAAGAAGLIEVKSPMVGTFYRAPAPEAPPYVEVGTRVSKGQTLCILEAMKLMNELESEVEGVVREVLIDNAEPVEYGQVLFRIDPNG
ncbi:MAG TPA: acetyl-CoA carboxylase biotin carboxyl carrier protein [Longimicrobiales bacterium]|nr:acetyl-CoA carboxylase biotin carboxyl carrier protein [Longimicrobiales bacterium]